MRLVFTLLLCTCTLSAVADVALPRIFSDHMVVQKSSRVPVWGKAEAGEKVKVTLGTASAEATTGQDGKWLVALDLSKADINGESVGMVVEGKNRVEVKDVLIGEVWLCSGQSNMEFNLSRIIGAEQELAASANTKGRLREFKVKRKQVQEPLDTVEGEWVPASPETSGRFSAVAYAFGRKLQIGLTSPDSDRVPAIGLITSCLGATPVEAWTSYGALSSDPALKEGTDRDFKALQDHPELKKAYATAYKDWTRKYQREDSGKLDKTAAEAFTLKKDTAGWKTVRVPGPLDSAGITKPGAVWFYRTADISTDQAGKDLRLVLGSPRGFESVYWNGSPVGSRTIESYRGEPDSREYLVPAKLLKPGGNRLAVRVFNPFETPQLTGKMMYSGDWLVKTEFELAPLTDEARAAMPAELKMAPDPKQVGSYLFNGMINGLIPYAIAGTVWYQGENNAERAWQYRTAFPLLIQDWRARWGQGDFPFYFCQLANYHAKVSSPGESDWAELRDAQSSALKLANTGMAVLIDIGEAADIHPRNKKDAGERLAAVALAKTYGKDLPYSGPVCSSMSVEGGKVRLRFEQTNGGLVAREIPAVHVLSSKENRTEKLVRNSPDSPLEGFAVCGPDHKWVWANATIDGDTVVVESPSVVQPVAVRYGWSKNPTCNLYNGAGFPASPFRTDDFPALTTSKKY